MIRVYMTRLRNIQAQPSLIAIDLKRQVKPEISNAM